MTIKIIVADAHPLIINGICETFNEHTHNIKLFAKRQISKN